MTSKKKLINKSRFIGLAEYLRNVCQACKIDHIKIKVKRPQTTGISERLHQIILN